ncbi:glycosyltransferase [Pannus brasiliensis CCIBt3594]|uniref:Glycosyltransferase n=1 Tax=Pannus brasiliensis CCIBt3594 TaxID=1427578 RepID=A0AAW9QQM2_9CHRO
MPKVSVCIPTYNRADYLVYSINSVLAQTYPDFELIVCDDGSIDRTPEMMAGYTDPRIRYLRHPKNIGRSLNMKSGFEAATGEYFIKFDDDDGLTPEFLARTVAVLDRDPTVDFVCSDHWIIDRDGQRAEAATKANSAKWGKNKLKEGIIPDLVRQTFQYQSLQVGSTLFRRAALAEVGYMRSEADGCEDFDLLVRLALAGKRGYFLPELLMEYRFHGGQTSVRQAIHFLSAKSFCLESYRFDDAELEKERVKRLAVLRESLGLRLIERGDTERGRELLEKAAEVLGKSRRSSFGLLLSYFPVNLRGMAFETFRKLRPKDYTERVRESG